MTTRKEDPVFVLVNPGTGPVEDTSEARAIAAIEQFVADVVAKYPMLIDPIVTYERRSHDDADGRYGFVLRRGEAETPVEMPGLPLEDVRYLDRGQNAWHFPWLYVDGNSWLWLYAVSQAGPDLADHDGSLVSAYKVSDERCKGELAATPRCPTCDAVRDSVQTNAWHHYGPQRIRCLGCEPHVVENRISQSGAVILDDGWKTKPHFFERSQLMPYADPDYRKICRRRVSFNSNDECRLLREHERPCRGAWKVLERTWIDPSKELR